MAARPAVASERCLEGGEPLDIELAHPALGVGDRVQVRCVDAPQPDSDAEHAGLRAGTRRPRTSTRDGVPIPNRPLPLVEAAAASQHRLWRGQGVTFRQVVVIRAE